MRIGLYGGTFDPIHLGHLIVIENAINEMKLDRVINNLDLDKIYVLPNSNPPHKLENKKTALNLRLKMVNETIKDNPKLEINDYDYRDNEIHYTFNTINYFNRRWKS